MPGVARTTRLPYIITYPTVSLALFQSVGERVAGLDPDFKLGPGGFPPDRPAVNFWASVGPSFV